MKKILCLAIVSMFMFSLVSAFPIESTSSDGTIKTIVTSKNLDTSFFGSLKKFFYELFIISGLQSSYEQGEVISITSAFSINTCSNTLVTISLKDSSGITRSSDTIPLGNINYQSVQVQHSISTSSLSPGTYYIADRWTCSGIILTSAFGEPNPTSQFFSVTEAPCATEGQSCDFSTNAPSCCGGFDCQNFQCVDTSAECFNGQTICGIVGNPDVSGDVLYECSGSTWHSQGRVDGKCGYICSPTASSSCSNGNIHWFNCAGVIQGIKQSCTNGCSTGSTSCNEEPSNFLGWEQGDCKTGFWNAGLNCQTGLECKDSVISSDDDICCNPSEDLVNGKCVEPSSNECGLAGGTCQTTCVDGTDLGMLNCESTQICCGNGGGNGGTGGNGDGEIGTDCDLNSDCVTGHCDKSNWYSLGQTCQPIPWSETIKLAITRDQLSDMTTTEMLGHACLYNSECESPTNFTAKCVPLEKLKDDGTITTSKVDAFFDYSNDLLNAGIFGGVLGGSIGLGVCAVGISATLVSAGFTFGGTLPLVVAELSACSGATLIGAGLGAGIAAGGTKIIMDVSSKDPIVDHFDAEDDSAIGICIAEEKSTGLDFFKFFAFFDITGDGQKDGTDGMIIAAILFFLTIILIKGYGRFDYEYEI